MRNCETQSWPGRLGHVRREPAKATSIEVAGQRCDVYSRTHSLMIQLFLADVGVGDLHRQSESPQGPLMPQAEKSLKQERFHIS